MTQRIIKFRAFDREKKEWIYSPDINDFEQAVSYFNQLEDNSDIEWDLQQFTGLLDKNGKEIFEGDIIYIAGYGDYVAEFPFTELYDAVAEKDIENILGNIYENPNLLK